MAQQDSGPRRSGRASLSRRWTIRIGVAIAAGLLFGAAGGVMGVNTLEPGRPAQPDSLQLMLDSIASGKTQAANDSLDAASTRTTPDAVVDSALTPADAIVVPDLIGVEEGAARTSLATAGFVVGTTEFRPSKSPAGTVLTTLPAAGASVARGTSVALVLSDGRPPVDSLAPVPAS